MFTGYKDLSPAALRELLRDNRDLNSVDFSGMEFKDSDLSGKRFTACRFSRSVFSGVNLDGCRFRMCFFEFARFWNGIQR